MNNQTTLHIKLFGDFLYKVDQDDTWHSLKELSGVSVGKKQRLFLVYLLFNHKRSISSAELIDQFWADDRKTPANSLKNMIHKTRVLLNSMFPCCKDLLQTNKNCYQWNNNVSIQLDTDVFERLYRTAKMLPDEERIFCEQEAFSLYNGDILPGESFDWLDYHNTYYRSVFVDLCKSLVVLLQEDDRWEESLHVCRHAYSFSPDVEEFTICFMNGLVNTGSPDLAIKHYEEYSAMLWQKYGLIPSDRVEEAFAFAVELNKKTNNFSGEFLQQLMQSPKSPKAFQCSLLVFRNLVQLELRNMIRSNHESSIVLLDICKTDTKQLSTDTRRLERILLYGLRAADPFTRLSEGATLLLLPGASLDNAYKVMERIDRSFHATYPKSKARLQYKVFPLSTE